MASQSVLLLNDKFDTKDTTKWVWGSGPFPFIGPTESKMVFPAVDYGANAENYMISAATWDASFGSLYFDLFQRPSGTAPAGETFVDLGYTAGTVSSGNRVYFRVFSSAGSTTPRLEAHYNLGGTDVVPVPDMMSGAEIPRYLRLRVDSTNLYFETVDSADGPNSSAWVVRCTLPFTTFTQSLLNVKVYIRTDGSASTNQAQFGGINVPGRATTVPGPIPSVTVQTGAKNIDVSWSIPTTGTPILSYGLTLLNGATLVDQVSVPGSGFQSYGWGGLIPGVTYTVNLWAVNDVGAGPVTTKLAKTTGPVVLPGPPTSVAASVVSDREVLVTWGEPTAGNRPTNYRVTSGPESGGGLTTGLSYLVQGLTPDTDYTFTVIALLGGADGGSATSGTVHTLQAPPPPPDNPPPPTPNVHAFPQPLSPGDVRVFRPANFGKTLTDVRKGD